MPDLWSSANYWLKTGVLGANSLGQRDGLLKRSITFPLRRWKHLLSFFTRFCPTCADTVHGLPKASQRIEDSVDQTILWPRLRGTGPSPWPSYMRSLIHEPQQKPDEHHREYLVTCCQALETFWRSYRFGGRRRQHSARRGTRLSR